VKLKNEDKYNKKKNKYNRIFGLRYPTHTETNSIFIQVRQRNGRLLKPTVINSNTIYKIIKILSQSIQQSLLLFEHDVFKVTSTLVQTLL